MASHGAALLFDLVARDGASPAFLKVAGAADKAATATARAQKGMAGSAAAMSRTGAKLSKAVTLPLLGIAAVSVTQAAKYQKSMNVIGVATDQTAKQMAGTSKGLLAIARSTGTGLGQLTDGLYTVEKGGLRGSAALAAVRAAAQGAKAEGADLGTVTNALTSIMASYGSKLRDPVAAMNMIVKGSGLAKTTLQDFASSLSTVVPVASSLGLGFDQVAGAIDTMTQHGETAQAATDNLRNLITNLAGQNNVASAAMQQLGINTVDLSKNLGKRGLTGTLDIVLNAIGKHSKDGLVVTSAFKQAATATASLKSELDAMPKSMQANARAFDSGKMSYKNFLAYAKSLGGQQFAMAKNFLSTESTAKGFNRQLTSGNGTVRTLATTLQKALGGMTGMNVALQLSGESADRFHSYVDEIGKSAHATQGDVLGWAQTQGTLSTKIDKAKASLQVMAVELGSALIPLVSKVADKFAGAAHWFDGLSSGQKKLLLFSVGAVAAAGPVLALGGKFMTLGRVMGNAAGSIGANLGMMAGTSFTTAARMGTAMRGVSAAIGGAAIGSAVGSLTQNSSKTVKAIGAFGSAAAGAALGFAAGGPWGAAIGGGVGLLSNLATSFLGAGKNAQIASSGVDAFTEAMKRDSDAIGSNVRALVENDLTKNGGFKTGKLFGLDPKTITDAALGIQSAVQKVREATSGTNQKAFYGRHPGTGYYPAVQELLKSVGVEKATIAQAKQNQADIAQANSKTLSDLRRDTISAAVKQVNSAQAAVTKGYKSLSAEVQQHGISLSGKSSDGEANISYITRLAGQQNKLVGINARLGATYDYVSSSVASSTAKLRQSLIADGFKQKSVDALIGTLKLTPKQVVTQMLANIKPGTANVGQYQSIIDAIQQHKVPKLDANSAQGKAIIADLQQKIDALRGKNVPINVSGNALATIAGIRGQVEDLHGKTIVINTKTNQQVALPGAAAKSHYKATGGIIRGPGSGTSDTAGVYALSNGEAVIPAKAVSAHRPLIDSLIQAGRGMAKGGVVGTVNGVAYTSKIGYENAKARASRSRAKADQSALSGDVSSAISGIGQAYSAPFSVADVGIARVRATINSATNALNRAIASGLAKGTADRYRSQIAGLMKLANSQLANLRLKIKGSDLNDLRKSLSGSADDIRAATAAMAADMRAAGVSAAKIAKLNATGGRLAAAQTQLSAMTDYRSTIRGTLAGQFDSTQYGSVTDLLGGFSTATAGNNTYAKNLNKLRGEAKGNKALLGYINQLAASGQTTTLATLAGASKGDLAKVSAAVNSYNGSLTAGSDAATTTEYGKSVAQQTKNVDTLYKSVQVLAGAVHGLSKAVGKHAASATPQTQKSIDEAVHAIASLGPRGRRP